MTPLEIVRAMAMIDSVPLLPGDAIVVLCGQDALARVQVAAQVFAQGGGSRIVLTGGLSDPKAGVYSADEMLGDLLGLGVSPKAVEVENQSLHTRHQAHHVLDIAEREEWVRLLVVASPYHVYRAFLTFVGALDDRGLAEAIHVLPVAASHTFWGERPPNAASKRLDLLSDEMEKIVEYGAREPAHLATWERAVEYILHWEGK